MVGSRPGVYAVVPVVDRNKPHAQKREYFFNIFSHLNKITAKPGKIFDDYAIGLPFPHGFHHLLKTWPLEVYTRISVVNPYLMEADLRVG